MTSPPIPVCRRVAVLLATVLLVLGLSGCFKASQDLKVKADGTGSVVFHFEINKKALAAMASSFGDVATPGGGSSPDEPVFKVVDKTFPDGTRVRTTDDRDRAELDASFDFGGPDDFRRKMEQIQQATALDSESAGGPVDGSLLVRRVGERMEVAFDVGGATEGAEQMDFERLGALLAADAKPSATVSVTMPGTVLDTNGIKDGRKVTWDLLARGAPQTLTASSTIAPAGILSSLTADEGDRPVWLIPAAAGAALVIVLLLVLLLLKRRRRRAKTKGAVVPAPPIGSTGAYAPSGPAGLPPREPSQQSPGLPDPSVWAQRPVDGPPAAGPGPSTAAPHGEPSPPIPGWGTTPADSPSEPPRWGSPVSEPPPGAPAPGAQQPWRVSPEPAPPDELPPWLARRPPDQPDPAPPTPAAFSTPAEPAPPPEPPTPPAPAPAARPEPPTEAVPAAGAPVPGWYADPAGGGGLRYWDGASWTKQTR